MWHQETASSEAQASLLDTDESQPEMWLPASDDPELEAALDVWLFGTGTS